MASVQRINNFIDGQIVATEAYLESFNPSTEEVIAQIADSSAEDANRAVQAAKRAFSSYVKKTLKDFF
jgi:acyl-CoA reductase-like NAD-dependent aldehyde dehydrogenase